MGLFSWLRSKDRQKSCMICGKQVDAIHAAIIGTPAQVELLVGHCQKCNKAMCIACLKPPRMEIFTSNRDEIMAFLRSEDFLSTIIDDDISWVLNSLYLKFGESAGIIISYECPKCSQTIAVATHERLVPAISAKIAGR